jgi:PIN domain nuclease of toxin-antitoxin system
MASKYVLDTHALIWYLEGSPRLSTRAKAIVDDSSNQLVVPMIVLAEAAFLVERSRVAISSVPNLLSDVQADPCIEVYPLNWDVFQQTLIAASIPEMHDRLIVATALHLQSLGHTTSLITRDMAITQSGLIPIIW